MARSQNLFSGAKYLPRPGKIFSSTPLDTDDRSQCSCYLHRFAKTGAVPDIRRSQNSTGALVEQPGYVPGGAAGGAAGFFFFFAAVAGGPSLTTTFLGGAWAAWAAICAAEARS